MVSMVRTPKIPVKKICQVTGDLNSTSFGAILLKHFSYMLCLTFIPTTPILSFISQQHIPLLFTIGETVEFKLYQAMLHFQYSDGCHYVLMLLTIFPTMSPSLVPSPFSSCYRRFLDVICLHVGNSFHKQQVDG